MSYNEPCDWCGRTPSEHNRDIHFACASHELELLKLTEDDYTEVLDE